MASKEDDEQEHTIAEDAVLTKYKAAADICNKALKAVIDLCVDGASLREVCKSGDRCLQDEAAKVYRKDKNMKKGVAFPTCLAVNHCIGHFSPLESDADLKLKTGDLVKIDMGAHVDGFIAVVAHTLVIGANTDKISGRCADVVLAAHYAFEAAMRLVRPTQENNTVTEMVSRVAGQFKCKPIEGMLSHQLQQNVINGDKTIIQNPSEAQRKEHDRCEFEQHEVYALDVLISTGDASSRELDARTTIYKKTDETYSLKMKTSREFFTQVSKKCGPMPFNLRDMADDEKRAKLGVVECVNHRLIEPFQVLYEKPDQLVAQFKATILLLPSGTKKITGLPFDADAFQSQHAIVDAEISTLLAAPLDKKSANKKKKKAARSVPQAVPAAEE